MAGGQIPKQPIGSRLHALLDYATGTSLITLSRTGPLRQRFAGRALLAAGAAHIAYSLVTDYELGAIRKIPYKIHLLMDALGASGLALAGRRRSGLDRWLPVSVGM